MLIISITEFKLFLLAFVPFFLMGAYFLIRGEV